MLRAAIGGVFLVAGCSPDFPPGLDRSGDAPKSQAWPLLLTSDEIAGLGTTPDRDTELGTLLVNDLVARAAALRARARTLQSLPVLTSSERLRLNRATINNRS